MKAAEITDAGAGRAQRAESTSFRHARINYANGDMVGHTGDFEAIGGGGGGGPTCALATSAARDREARGVRSRS